MYALYMFTWRAKRTQGNARSHIVPFAYAATRATAAAFLDLDAHQSFSTTARRRSVPNLLREERPSTCSRVPCVHAVRVPPACEGPTTAVLQLAQNTSGVLAPPCSMRRDERGNRQEEGLHRAEERYGSRERATQRSAEVVHNDDEGVVLDVPRGLLCVV